MEFLTLGLFVLAVFLSLVVNDSEKRQKAAIFILFFALILLAAFRDGTNMPDYKVYSDKYAWEVRGSGSDLEPSFKYICLFANAIAPGNVYIMFLIYAIVGVSLKFKAIQRLAPYFLFSCVVYISNFYLLHEMIQIRVGVASALILLAIYPLYKRDFLNFSLLIVIATFFHYSSLAALFLWFFKPTTFSKIFYLFLIIAAYIIYLSSGGILDLVVKSLSSIPLFSKLEVYSDLTRRSDLVLNPFGIYPISRLIICIYFVNYYNRIAKKYSYFPLLLKIYVISLFIYVAFASFPDIGYRISMLFMTTEIFVIPMFIYSARRKSIGKMMVIGYSLLTIVFNIFFTSYFSYSL